MPAFLTPGLGKAGWVCVGIFVVGLKSRNRYGAAWGVVLTYVALPRASV